MPFGRASLLLSSLVLLASACATYQTELNQGIKYYDSNEHEKSLAIFRVLEPDIDSLKADERVRYYYYRGMTDYRLNNDKYDVSADARHWLALAAAAEAETPASLTSKQISLMCESLGELNRRSYNQGASDTPVVEFKVCKDKATDAGVEKDDKGAKKDEGEGKKKDEGEGKKKPKKGDELARAALSARASPPAGARTPPTMTSPRGAEGVWGLHRVARWSRRRPSRGGSGSPPAPAPRPAPPARCARPRPGWPPTLGATMRRARARRRGTGKSRRGRGASSQGRATDAWRRA